MSIWAVYLTKKLDNSILSICSSINPLEHNSFLGRKWEYKAGINSLSKQASQTISKALTKGKIIQASNRKDSNESNDRNNNL